MLMRAMVKSAKRGELRLVLYALVVTMSIIGLIPERAEYFLWRLMIDRRYQRQGYGRQAMRTVIDYVRTLPNATAFYTSHLRGNHGAAAFYRGLGFQYTGDETDGDLLMRMSLEPDLH